MYTLCMLRSYLQIHHLKQKTTKKTDTSFEVDTYAPMQNQEGNLLETMEHDLATQKCKNSGCVERFGNKMKMEGSRAQ